MMRLFIAALIGSASVAAALVAHPQLEDDVTDIAARGPPVPASDECSARHYWDSGRGCLPDPAPSCEPSGQLCGYKQYYDTRKGCTAGPPPSGPFGDCAAVRSIVSLAHDQQPATAFCSSYLHVPERTIVECTTVYKGTTTTTITHTATDTTRPTSIVYTPTTSADTVTTATVTGTTTTTVTVSTCSTPSPVFTKRKRDAEPTPDCVPTGLPAAEVTSFCKCLSIKPSTTTSTSTETRKSSKVVTHTARQTVTVTSPLFVTTASTVTAATTATTTVTTVTSTTYALATPTFSMLALFSGSGNYGFFSVIEQSGAYNVQAYNSDGNSGSLFQFDSTNEVRGADTDVYNYYAAVNGDTDTTNIYLDQTLDGLFFPIQCSLQYNEDDGSCPLQCFASNGFGVDDQSASCGDYWNVGYGPFLQGNGCTFFQPYAIT